MTVYRRRGDGVEGEVLAASFREMSKPRVVVGSGRHRVQRARLRGTPARCFINREVRSLERRER